MNGQKISALAAIQTLQIVWRVRLNSIRNFKSLNSIEPDKRSLEINEEEKNSIKKIEENVLTN